MLVSGRVILILKSPVCLAPWERAGTLQWRVERTCIAGVFWVLKITSFEGSGFVHQIIPNKKGKNWVERFLFSIPVKLWFFTAQFFGLKIIRADKVIDISCETTRHYFEFSSNNYGSRKWMKHGPKLKLNSFFIWNLTTFSAEAWLWKDEYPQPNYLPWSPIEEPSWIPSQKLT